MEKEVRIFRSFEEAEAADALRLSRMDPRERIAIFFAIRDRAHPEANQQGIARVCRVIPLKGS